VLSQDKATHATCESHCQIRPAHVPSSQLLVCWGCGTIANGVFRQKPGKEPDASQSLSKPVCVTMG